MARTLLDKLGFKPEMPTLLHAVPPELSAALYAPMQSVGEPPGWLIGFAHDRAALAEAAAALVPHYRRGGILWLCYPKKTGALKSDITRDSGWEPVSEAGLLGVTQVALDETWSALRFRYRDEIKTLTRKTATGGGSR
jgi:hypothetical protein